MYFEPLIPTVYIVTVIILYIIIKKTFLNTIIYILFVLFLINPVLKFKTKKSIKPEIKILIDDSYSMSNKIGDDSFLDLSKKLLNKIKNKNNLKIEEKKFSDYRTNDFNEICN